MTAQYYGRAWFKTPTRWPLSLDGKPVPVSESFTQRMLNNGQTVEIREQRTRLVKHANYKGETVTEWHTIATLSPTT